VGRVRFVECLLVVALGPGLTGAACDVRLYPLRAQTTGQDSGALPDAAVPIGACPSDLIGFGAMSDPGGEWDGGTGGMPPQPVLDGGATGGGSLDGGTLVVVDATDSDALAQFSMYAGDKVPGPLTIVVKGVIFIPPPPDGGSGDLQKIRVSSNKTVIGANVLPNPGAAGSGSGFTGGGLTLTDVSNVVVRNLVIAMPNPGAASDNVDAIHIEGSRQIWIDHCDLSSNGASDPGASYDGLIDISDGSDFVTVSWTHYHDHADVGLIGRSDSSAAAAQDAAKDHVTFDHDWYSNVASGPRIRFGTVHVLNSFFDGVTNYAIASTDGASVRIEASYFNDVTATQADPDFGPVATILEGATEGDVDLLSDNKFVSSGTNQIAAQDMVPFAVPYPYTPDSRDSVPALVPSCAGTGKIAAPTGN